MILAGLNTIVPGTFRKFAVEGEFKGTPVLTAFVLMPSDFDATLKHQVTSKFKQVENDWVLEDVLFEYPIVSGNRMVGVKVTIRPYQQGCTVIVEIKDGSPQVLKELVVEFVE